MPASSKSFLLKLAAYLVPVGVYLALTVGLAVYSGEFASLHEVAIRQSASEPLLYGRAYRDNYYAFKLISARQRRPEILVLGSSRTMQYRSQLFSRNPEAFYNAGGAVQNTFEIREFLNSLGDSALPKLLIVGLDQPWFNARTAEGFSRRRIQEQVDDEQVLPLNRAMNVGRFMFTDLLHGKIPIARVLKRRDPLYGGQALGIAAVTRGGGFRNDGSYQYDAVLDPKPVDQRLAEGYQRLRDNVGHFSGGDTVARNSLREIRSLLEFCAAKGIQVAGFSPPFAASIYRDMAAGGKHAYLARSADSLAGIFQEKGFAYYDFTDESLLGTGDEDMVDGFHGSEFVYLKIHLAMVKGLPESFRGLVDEEALLAAVSAPRAHRLVVFNSNSR